jgi:tight adherence protein B
MTLQNSLTIMIGAVAAGALLSFSANDVFRSIPGATEWLRSSLIPLRRAGDEGYLPDRGERRRLGLVASGAVLLFSVLVAGVGPMMLLATAGPALAFAVIKHRRSRYRMQVEIAIPEVTATLSDSLSGGASLQGALLEAGRSLQGPPAKEFARVRVDLDLGLSARESLDGLSRRVGSERIDALVTMLISGTRSGGDLVVLLRRFGEADRSRRRALKDANSATAQARYTGMLVVAMPAGAALFAEVVSPGFFAGILADPASTLLLSLAGLLQFIGLLAVKRLGRSAER